MVEVEVRAAHNALEACAHAETVERVVFTSSVTAVVWGGRRRSPDDDDDRVVDERDWSEPNFCRRLKVTNSLQIRVNLEANEVEMSRKSRIHN